MSPFSFDQSVTDWVLSIRGEPWNSAWQMVTVLGDTVTLTLVVIGVFMLAWLGERIDLAVLIAFGGVSAYLLMMLLKRLFGRDRPPVVDRLIDVGGLSFPSGHAMVSTVVYGLTALIFYQLYGWVRQNPWVLAAAPAVVIVVGLSRVYLAAHWLSDVIFGWTIGLIWLGVAVVVHRQIANWVRARTQPV